MWVLHVRYKDSGALCESSPPIFQSDLMARAGKTLIPRLKQNTFFALHTPKPKLHFYHQPKAIAPFHSSTFYRSITTLDQILRIQIERCQGVAFGSKIGR